MREAERLDSYWVKKRPRQEERPSTMVVKTVDFYALHESCIGVWGGGVEGCWVWWKITVASWYTPSANVRIQQANVLMIGG